RVQVGSDSQNLVKGLRASRTKKNLVNTSGLVKAQLQATETRAPLRVLRSAET
ncbi:hypothetical protein GJ744_011432, partial [Endocarpon pusillum]